MKTYFKIIILPAILCLLILLGKIYFDAAKNWEAQASAYPTKNEFIILNYASLFKYLLLKSGASDDNFIYSWLNDISQNAYMQGVSKIPEDDAERLYWEYMNFLRPYEGGSAEPDKVFNKKLIVSEALHIITNYPYQNAKNKWFLYDSAFTQTAYSFDLALYNYAQPNYPSKEDAKKIIIASEAAFKKFSSDFPLDNKRNIGVYGLFLMHLMHISAAQIALEWSEENYECDDPLVKAYQDIRINFPKRISKVLSRAELKRANYSTVSKYQKDAESILAKKCNIHFSGE